MLLLINRTLVNMDFVQCIEALGGESQKLCITFNNGKGSNKLIAGSMEDLKNALPFMSPGK